ncbi:MAG: Signal transduction histidine, partial [Rhodospirillaceae bacterium]
GDHFRQGMLPAAARIPLVSAVILSLVAVAGANAPPVNFFESPFAYLPLHTTLEVVAIVISAMVCGLGWHQRLFAKSSTMIVLGATFLPVAVIDLLHTLSYQGMSDLVTPSGPEKAINFWLAGRAAAAVGLLSIATLPRRIWPAAWTVAAFAVAAGLVLAVIWIGLWHADWLPRTFVPGKGLTTVKVASEYALMALYGVSAVFLARRGRASSEPGLFWLAAGAWTLAVGESFFTLYAHVTDIYNLLGHVYKAAAYLMIYRALFIEGIQAPYRLLARERGFLRGLLSSIPDLVWLKDPKGVYLACNPQFERFFGASEAKIVGKTDYDFVERDLADFFRRKDMEALAAGRSVMNQEWITYADSGKSVLLEVIKTPMLNDDGSVVGVLGIGRDITDRTRLEGSLRMASADLEQFAYVAAHDLREPLRTISSFLTLLERRYDDSLDAEAHQFIAFARDGAATLDQKILDLLNYARLGHNTGAVAPVSLAEIVAETVASLRPAIDESGADISVGGGLPRVAIPREDLVRLFHDLIGNAIKYRAADRSPRIRITCQPVDNGWQIGVSDNGIGIEPQYFERIFIIFQRLHTGDAFKGTGIGLATCKKIVECHGGRIWVESVPGQGSTFFFTLPSAPS